MQLRLCMYDTLYIVLNLTILIYTLSRVVSLSYESNNKRKIIRRADLCADSKEQVVA